MALNDVDLTYLLLRQQTHVINSLWSQHPGFIENDAPCVSRTDGHIFNMSYPGYSSIFNIITVCKFTRLRITRLLDS